MAWYGQDQFGQAGGSDNSLLPPDALSGFGQQQSSGSGSSPVPTLSPSTSSSDPYGLTPVGGLFGPSSEGFGSILSGGGSGGSLLASLLGGGGGSGGFGSLLGLGGIGAGLGSMLGGLFGNFGGGAGATASGQEGGQIGGEVGGLAGSALGPLGTLGGSAIGDLLGTLLGSWIGGGVPSMAKPNAAMNALNARGGIDSLLAKYIGSGTARGYDLSQSGAPYNPGAMASALQLLSGQSLGEGSNGMLGLGNLGFGSPVSLYGISNLPQLQGLFGKGGSFPTLQTSQIAQIMPMLSQMANRMPGDPSMKQREGYFNNIASLATKLKNAESY